MFGWATQAAVAAQSEQEAPFSVWAGVEDCLRLLPAYEVMTGCVLFEAGLQVGKGVLLNQALTDGGTEKLLGDTRATGDRVLGQSYLDGLAVPRLVVLCQPDTPLISITRRNILQWLADPKVLDKTAASMPVDSRGATLYVGTDFDVGIQKGAELNAVALSDESRSSKLVGHRRLQLGNPMGRVGIDWLAGQLRGEQLLNAILDSLSNSM